MVIPEYWWITGNLKINFVLEYFFIVCYISMVSINPVWKFTLLKHVSLLFESHYNHIESGECEDWWWVSSYVVVIFFLFKLKYVVIE